MFTDIARALKAWLETKVNADEVQVGFYGDISELDLRMSAILIEPLTLESAAKSTVWRKGEFDIRLWVLVGIERDYLTSMEAIENIFSAEDTETQKFGVIAALTALQKDPGFSELSGSMGGKLWRVGAGVLETGRVRFSVMMRGSERINAGQMELSVKIDIQG